MTTTELIGPLDAPDGVEHPAHDEGLGELFRLIGVVPGEGPPIILLAGPLVLFALALAGPFLLLLTLVVLLVACAALVALAGAIVASPYLLVRRFGTHRRPRAHRSAPDARFVPVDSGRGPA
jgi:hypothetical protein